MTKFSDLYIRDKDDLMEAVESFGFLPFFENSIPGFSISEHAAPEIWFPDEGEGVWEWKGPVIRETGCAYGKFFEKKAAFVSREWIFDLANYRRDGYDYEGFFNDGFASYSDKYLYDLIAERGPLLSKELKRIGGYGKDGRKGFDTSIVRLQAQCFVVISDFVYQTDKKGREYGWGIAEYSTPEKMIGGELYQMYEKSPQESYERLLKHFKELLPGVPEKDIVRFLG